MKPLALFTAAVLLACAHGAPSEQFTFHSTATAYQVSVTPEALSGPQYQVSRRPDGLRGFVNDDPVELQAKDHQIVGSRGSLPVSLKLTTEGEVTRIHGLYGGEIDDLTVSAQEISGRVGRCSYSLSRAESDYRGFSACGGRQVPTSVHLPAGMTEHPDATTAAMLAVLLGG